MAIASAIVGGLIAGAGAVGAAAIGSSASKNASKAAQQSADQATAFQRESRDQNITALAPWQQSGLAANNQINALLGLGGGQMAQPMGAQGGFQGGGFNDYSQIGGGLFNDMSNFGGTMMQGQGAPLSATSSADAARAAFDQFRNSTGYQFRLGGGMNAVNSGYAGRGSIKSGAAVKAANDYGQGMATQEFGNYMGYLGNQANAGLSAVNAQAGVSTSAANNMGNIAMQNGANQANAAMLRAQNNGQLVNSLATIGGNLAGQLYRPGLTNDVISTMNRNPGIF